MKHEEALGLTRTSSCFMSSRFTSSDMEVMNGTQTDDNTGRLRGAVDDRGGDVGVARCATAGRRNNPARRDIMGLPLGRRGAGGNGAGADCEFRRLKDLSAPRWRAGPLLRCTAPLRRPGRRDCADQRDRSWAGWPIIE